MALLPRWPLPRTPLELAVVPWPSPEGSLRRFERVLPLKRWLLPRNLWRNQTLSAPLPLVANRNINGGTYVLRSCRRHHYDHLHYHHHRRHCHHLYITWSPSKSEMVDYCKSCTRKVVWSNPLRS
jgi:hypothetical protein